MDGMDAPKLKGFGFSPFWPARVTSSQPFRIGVPGYGLYSQNWHILFRWSGTSFQMVLTNPLFLFYMVLLACSVFIFSIVEYTPWLRGTTVPPSFGSSVNSLCIFMLTFFMSQCFSESKARFENVCKTNGNVTRLSALAAGILSQEQARVLMRYINAIMHIYYLLLSGPLDDEKWSVMQRRGLLTEEEIKALQLQGSPAVVLYSWAIKVLRSNATTEDGDDISERVFLQVLQPMEEQFGGARGLAAKQIAYTLYQIPSVYYHIVYVAVNVYLACTVYDTGHATASALSGPCVAGGANDDECISRVVFIVFTEVILIILFLGLLLTAEGLSDIYGNRGFQYDLGNDLDNLWQESQNVLKSMAVECPSIRKPQTNL